MNNQKGFTLVELLIYLAIMGVVAVSLVYFNLSITSARIKTSVGQEVQANARLALEVISRKIREAEGVNWGSSGLGTDPGLLSLGMSEVTNNPTIFDLDEDNGRLRMTEGSGPTVYITSNKVRITNLIFGNLTGDSERDNVRIEIVIEYDSEGDVNYDYVRSYETAVSVRK